ncbi:hypothetical protein EIP86_002403, partial [Pleurotus ostreatoroseus]
ATGGPPSDPSDPSSAIPGASAPSSVPAYDATIPDAPTAAPPSDAFVLSFADGSGSIKAPKKRKARSDKGKPRGPNMRSKKSRTEAQPS